MKPDRYGVRVTSHLEGVHEFQEEMRAMGIAVVVDTSFVDEMMKDLPKESIGVGCSVTHTIAIPVVRCAMKRWPQVKYVSLSSDYFKFVEERCHYIISVGERKQFDDNRCREWTKDAISELHEPIGLGRFHELIRRFSYPPPPASAFVTMVGGPMDGQDLNLARGPEGLPKYMDLLNGRYTLKCDGTRIEYHFSNKRPT